MYNDPKAKVRQIDLLKRHVAASLESSAAGWNPWNLPLRASDPNCRPQALGQGEPVCRMATSPKVWP